MFEGFHALPVTWPVTVLTRVTIFVRFNVPPLFIVPPPREREHVPTGSVPPSRLAGAVVTHGTTHENLPAQRARRHSLVAEKA